MKTLILAFGNTGVTRKAAERLAELLGGADIAEKPPKDLGGYDHYVIGTNVRFGKLNKRFRKFAKKKRAFLEELPVYLYVVGVEIERSEKYIELARRAIPSAREIRYVWGELNTEDVSSFERFFIKCYIDGRNDDHLPKPRLLDKELRALSESVKENF